MAAGYRRRSDSTSPRPRRHGSPERRHDDRRQAHAHAGDRRDMAYRPEPKIQVVLSDLDYVRPTITVAVKTGVRISKIEEAVRRYLGDQVSEDERLLFYGDGRELAEDDPVDWRSTMHYRVLRSKEPSGSRRLRITFDADDAKGRELCSELGPELVEDFYAGSTVGEMRQKVADRMGIEDANRVVVVARGGMRPGTLPGNEWQARQVESWLCQRLSIEICPDSDYLVLHSQDREYIYHPWNASEDGASVKDVKTWIEKRLLRDVHQRCLSRVRVRSDQVRLSRKGRQVRNVVPWGSTLDFEVPSYVDEIFSAEEAWLYPISTSCSVCCEDKRKPEMPLQITKKCDHEPKTCRGCLQQWIASSMDAYSWDRLRCPECTELLQFEDIKAYASRNIFERYDTLATRAVLRDIPNFRWCLEEGCGSGQIHDPSCVRFKCVACRGKHCTNHNVRWHSGETCQEYDKRNKARKKEEKASEATIKEISKNCPECKRPVNKYTGCNHITCVCGHEWCYICFRPWKLDPITHIISCEHTGECPERHNNPFLEAMFGDFPIPPPPMPHGFIFPEHVPPPPRMANPFVRDDFPFPWMQNPVPPPAPMPPMFAGMDRNMRRNMAVAAGVGVVGLAAVAAARRERERERARETEAMYRRAERSPPPPPPPLPRHYRPGTPPRGTRVPGRVYV